MIILILTEINKYKIKMCIAHIFSTILEGYEHQNLSIIFGLRNIPSNH